MNMELRECPFCGGEASFDHDDNGWNWVVCEKCGVSTDCRTHTMEDCHPLLAEQWNRRASPASAPEGFTLSAPTLLPDGSGFGIMSFPLPKDHWLYKECEYAEGAVEPNDLPVPILTHSLRQQVIAAIRYAVRSATNCGKEDDFDPDALVQNAVYALCGPYGKAAPTPPVSEDRKDAERFREGWTHACNALCMEIALWIERCPHCGRPAPKAPTMQEDKKP